MHVEVSTKPGWMMDSPTSEGISRGASTCVLLRMYGIPPRVTSEPNVPPQQVMVCVDVFVVESGAFPPEVPSSIAPDWACWFTGITVTLAVPDCEAFTCETA